MLQPWRICAPAVGHITLEQELGRQYVAVYAKI